MKLSEFYALLESYGFERQEQISINKLYPSLFFLKRIVSNKKEKLKCWISITINEILIRVKEDENEFSLQNKYYLATPLDWIEKDFFKAYFEENLKKFQIIN